MRKLLIVGALIFLPLAAQAQQPSQAEQNLSNDLMVSESAQRHLRESIVNYAKDQQQTIADLAGQLKWFRDCAAETTCWNWVKPPEPKTAEVK